MEELKPGAPSLKVLRKSARSAAKPVPAAASPTERKLSGDLENDAAELDRAPEVTGAGQQSAGLAGPVVSLGGRPRGGRGRGAGGRRGGA